jgi:thiol-disulfide isomerase/thioredoxin
MRLLFTMLTIVLLEAFVYSNVHQSSLKARTPADTVYKAVSFILTPAVSAGKKHRLDFYYHDALSNGYPFVIAGESSKLLLSKPTLLFASNDMQVPFLIYPGETISVKYAGTDSLQMYINGNDKRSNELNFFRKLVEKTGNIYYGFKVMPYHKAVKTMDEFHTLEARINNLKTARLSFLSMFDRQTPMGDDFKRIAMNTIRSTAINDSLLLYSNNKGLLKDEGSNREFIRKKLTTIKNIGYMPYQNYLVACTNLLSLGAVNQRSIILNAADFKNRFDFACNNFYGMSKDFLLANLMYTSAERDIVLPAGYLKKFQQECLSDFYRMAIVKKLQEKKEFVSVKGSDNLLSIDGKSTQNLMTVFSHFENKVILLDFWASWCGPCREEMPFMNVLKRRYKTADLVVLSISMDRDVSSWRKANVEESLSNNNSFLLVDGDKAAFIKQYKIMTLPRYVLISKGGKVVNSSAPRPSDASLTRQIDQILHEKKVN